jgi:AmmeMemoRadiSam system protein B
MSNTPRHAESVQPCRLAGRWYPAQPEALRREVRRCLAGAEPPDGPVCAVLLPHAGYAWSGPTAGQALGGLDAKRYRRVVVIGPSHQVYMPGFSSLPRTAEYETPLGRVPLDRARIEALLAEEGLFRTVEQAHREEHSVQIQLPLLQEVLGDFELVPVVTGDLTVEQTARTARCLAARLDAETLVVASSDFTHYGAGFNYRPFDEAIEENLEKLDLGAWAFAEQQDAEGFLQYVQRTGATVCGRIPIAVLLSMLNPGMRLRRTAYTTSGRLTGDFSHTVSYLSARVEGVWNEA